MNKISIFWFRRDLRLFDNKGALVKTLYEEHADKGILYHLTVNAADLPRGIYYCHLKTTSGAYTQKLIRY